MEKESLSFIDAVKFIASRYEISIPTISKDETIKAEAKALRSEILMETVKVCSLGTITQALYEVGGKYRRNM